MQKYEHIEYQYPAGCRTVEVEDGRRIAVCTTTGEVYGEYITSDFTPTTRTNTLLCVLLTLGAVRKWKNI